MGWENLFDYMFSTLPNVRLGKDNFTTALQKHKANTGV